jgi:protein SCO1
VRPRTSLLRARALGPASLLLVLALTLAACGPASSTAVASEGLSPQEDGWRGLPVEEPQRLPAASLLDTDGERVELGEDFLGDPTLLFFGYTSCPDICPIHLAAITAAMGQAGVSFDDLDVVFVSVDPDRDTPERIDDFVANFDRRIVGLYEDLEVVEAALAQLDLTGPIVEGPDPRGDGDLIGHPAQVIGFDAEGQAQRVWPFGARRSDWVADLPRVVEEWSSEDEA